MADEVASFKKDDTVWTVNPADGVTNNPLYSPPSDAYEAKFLAALGWVVIETTADPTAKPAYKAGLGFEYNAGQMRFATEGQARDFATMLSIARRVRGV